MSCSGPWLDICGATRWTTFLCRDREDDPGTGCLRSSSYLKKRKVAIRRAGAAVIKRLMPLSPTGQRLGDPLTPPQITSQNPRYVEALIFCIATSCVYLSKCSCPRAEAKACFSLFRTESATWHHGRWSWRPPSWHQSSFCSALLGVSSST